jgi:hypothetical protein
LLGTVAGRMPAARVAVVHQDALASGGKAATNGEISSE